MFILRSQVFIILPFVFLILGEIISYSNEIFGQLFKIGAFMYIWGYSVLQFRTHLLLFVTFCIFILYLFIHIPLSFNLNAALESSLRYLYPIGVLFFSYAIRKRFPLLLKLFLIFVLINDFWQLINYFWWIKGETQWFYQVSSSGIPYVHSVAGVLRATGLLGFFSLFGFVNIIAFFLTYFYYSGKFRNPMLWVFFIGVIQSTSFKGIGAFLFMLFFVLSNLNKIRFVVLGFFAILVLLFVYPEIGEVISNNIDARLAFYIVEGNSARAESYRVMIDSFYNFDLFGYGVGSFGGPESIKYNSPVYSDVNFGWYGLDHLSTTDTYFPHLFVELGMFGFILYLLLLCSPIFYKTTRFIPTILIIYFVLMFESLWSFALNNLTYLMFSLVFIFPILEHERINGLTKKLC